LSRPTGGRVVIATRFSPVSCVVVFTVAGLFRRLRLSIGLTRLLMLPRQHSVPDVVSIPSLVLGQASRLRPSFCERCTTIGFEIWTICCLTQRWSQPPIAHPVCERVSGLPCVSSTVAQLLVVRQERWDRFSVGRKSIRCEIGRNRLGVPAWGCRLDLVRPLSC